MSTPMLRSAVRGVTRGRAGTLWFIGGLAFAVASIVAATPVGASDVSLSQVWSSLGGRLGFDVPMLSASQDSLIWNLRIPRTIMAALVGAALAMCGVVLQSLTGNDLAEPYLLGMSSGASFGAVTAVALGLAGASMNLTIGALLGGVASLVLLMLLIGRSDLDALRVVLVGIIVGQLFNALMSVVLVASTDSETTRALTFWLMGSMSSARWDSVVFTAVVLAVSCASVAGFHRDLDLLSFGADTASSLGVHVQRTRMLLLLVTSLLTAACVASVGAIGFVGLIVPHLARFVVGPTHRRLLPVAGVMGAVLLVWTDASARVLFAPRELPVGTLTALIGVPIFCVVMKRRGLL